MESRQTLKTSAPLFKNRFPLPLTEIQSYKFVLGQAPVWCRPVIDAASLFGSSSFGTSARPVFLKAGAKEHVKFVSTPV